MNLQLLPLQSWTSAPGRDSSLEYRLSIYHARINDTGTYTCVTPYEKEHSIDIIVKEVSTDWYETNDTNLLSICT